MRYNVWLLREDGTPSPAGPSSITADGIEYTAGQYASREIWPAVLDYFNQTNGEG
jgi:hypothetical protein